MIWSFQEQVQAVIQTMKMSVLQCLKVDQVPIVIVFHMTLENLIAEAFTPLYTYGVLLLYFQ
jgi:hypothetical protein